MVLLHVMYRGAGAQVADDKRALVPGSVAGFRLITVQDTVIIV